MNYTDFTIIRHYNEIVTNNANDYKLMFVTFTFKNIKRSNPYSDYSYFFEAYKRKLYNHLRPRPDSKKEKPFLLLFPESSPAIHFHGIMGIHNQTTTRFGTKFVSYVIPEYCEAVERDVPSIHMQPIFLQPPLTSNYQYLCEEYNRAPLQIDDYRIYPVDVSEVDRVLGYAQKRLLASDFAYDDVLLF